MDLREWVIEYFTVYKRMFLKESTLAAYQYAMKHIPFGIDYDSLSVFDIQNIINCMIGNNLSWSTIMHTFTLISQALSHAQNYGLQDKSHILKGIILPKRNKKQINAFSMQQRINFLQNNCTFHGEHFEFLLLTGIRVGELIGIKQCDIDVTEHLLIIRRNYYNGQYQTPKTPDSYRTIPLCGRAWVIVRKRIKLHCPDAPLFCGKNGNVLNYRSMLSSFRQTLCSAGLNECGLHVLRHTFATDLLREGVSIKVISELLGHKDITVTCNTYSDVTLDMKYNALELLAK